MLQEQAEGTFDLLVRQMAEWENVTEKLFIIFNCGEECDIVMLFLPFFFLNLVIGIKFLSEHAAKTLQIQG